MPGQVRTLIDRAVRIAQAKRAVTGVIIPNDLQDVDYIDDDTNHLGGTARTGDNSASSVVNADCRSWDISNLWVCDGSVFPTVGGVNPALTIQTIAMRTASRIGILARGGEL